MSILLGNDSCEFCKAQMDDRADSPVPMVIDESVSNVKARKETAEQKPTYEPLTDEDD